MPYDDPDTQDPMLLVGVELDGSVESQREMASVFAEEFARLGFDKKHILRLFHNSIYAAAHRALIDLGEEEILRLVSEVVEIWSRVRLVHRDAPDRPEIPEGGLLWPRSTTGS